MTGCESQESIYYSRFCNLSDHAGLPAHLEIGASLIAAKVKKANFLAHEGVEKIIQSSDGNSSNYMKNEVVEKDKHLYPDDDLDIIYDQSERFSGNFDLKQLEELVISFVSATPLEHEGNETFLTTSVEHEDKEAVSTTSVEFEGKEPESTTSVAYDGKEAESTTSVAYEGKESVAYEGKEAEYTTSVAYEGKEAESTTSVQHEGMKDPYFITEQYSNNLPTVTQTRSETLEEDTCGMLTEYSDNEYIQELDNRQYSLDITQTSSGYIYYQ